MNLNQESGPTPSSERGAVMKLVVGGGIVVAGFTTFAFGSVGQFRSVLPLGMTAGMVVFGLGLHAVLWSGPRAASRVPRNLRGLVSAVATFGIVMAVSVVLGIGVGLARRHLGAGAGWTDLDRSRFEDACLQSWAQRELGATRMLAVSYCSCWRSYAEEHFPVVTAIRFDPRDPDVLAAQKSCVERAKAK